MNAFNGFTQQLKQLEKANKKIDWSNAEPSLQSIYYRQQDIILCNASDTRKLLDDVVNRIGDWDRVAAKKEAKSTEDKWVAALKARNVEFTYKVCSNVRAP